MSGFGLRPLQEAGPLKASSIGDPPGSASVIYCAPTCGLPAPWVLEQ